MLLLHHIINQPITPTPSFQVCEGPNGILPLFGEDGTCSIKLGGYGNYNFIPAHGEYIKEDVKKLNDTLGDINIILTC